MAEVYNHSEYLDDSAQQEQRPNITSGPKSAAEDVTVKTVQKSLTPEFWATIWIPFVSFLWTVLLFYTMFQSGSQRKLLSKVQKIIIISMDFFWFFAVAILIVIVLTYICHGGASAFLVRTAIRLTSLFQIDFGFCSQIPDPGI